MVWSKIQASETNKKKTQNGNDEKDQACKANQYKNNVQRM